MAAARAVALALLAALALSQVRAAPICSAMRGVPLRLPAACMAPPAHSELTPEPPARHCPR
jgi:hypothetical protein